MCYDRSQCMRVVLLAGLFMSMSVLAEVPNAEQEVMFKRGQQRNMQLKRYQAQLAETEARAAHLRANLSVMGYSLPGHVSLPALRLSAAAKAQQEAAEERRANLAKLEEIKASFAQGKDPSEVDSIVQADCHVRYLEQRLEDAEIRLTVQAWKTDEQPRRASTQPAADGAMRNVRPNASEIELERDAIANRLTTAKNSAKVLARPQLIEDSLRRDAALKSRLDVLATQVDELTSNLSEMNNFAAALSRTERMQESLQKRLDAVQDELDTLDVTMSTR